MEVPMVAYSFAPRFIAPIRAGTKTQTIRANGKRRHAEAADMLQLYAGMRTAHCQRILPDVRCTQAMPIVIHFQGTIINRIEVWGLPVRGLDAFARRDGFDDIFDMERFWFETHGDMTTFQGTVIEWAPPADMVAKAVAA
jgi:hypothetical protein